MKALTLLKSMRELERKNGLNTQGTDEAIAELEEINLSRREWYQKGYNEAMGHKTCDGCIDEEISSNRCEQCVRLARDFYEPKSEENTQRES